MAGFVASTADVGSFAWRRLVPHGAMASPGTIGRPLAFNIGRVDSDGTITSRRGRMGRQHGDRGERKRCDSEQADPCP